MVRRLHRMLALLLPALAALAGVIGAISLYDSERQLSVGTIDVGVSPGHHGALDLYVPLVDWGARFSGVRLPARLTIEVRAVNRDVAERVAAGRSVDVAQVRTEARDAIASYLRTAFVLALVCGVLLGTLVAFALRTQHWTRVRAGVLAATGTSIVAVVVVALLLPPRGRLADPTYYAHGPDLPRALDALQALRRSRTALDQELNDQLVGLARLVVSPGEQAILGGRPRLVLASDLHNNVLALPALERAARGLPLVFAGDLTDKGTPLETALVQRAAHAGKPTVMIGGNHDSDTLLQQLADAGAIVLTQQGRLLPGGRHGPMIVRVAGLRMAGYTDPFLRHAGQAYEDRFHQGLVIAAQEAFRRWAEPLVGKVDVIVVHEPEVAESFVDELRRNPPARPLVVLDGHTHVPDLHADKDLLEVNGGTIGAGGTGNLTDERSNLSLAVITYRLQPTFLPLAVDQVSIDPGSGSSSARRVRVDRALRGKPTDADAALAGALG